MKRTAFVLLPMMVGLLAPAQAGAQAAALEPVPAELRDLIAEARSTNPQMAAARRMADAAAARVPQAGALPDPMLAVGVMSVPARSLSLSRDEMTMSSVQLSQRLPAFGTRRLRTAAARELHRSALSEADEVELDVIARLKAAYYEAVFIERALTVLARNRALLVDVAEVARGRFAVGQAPQQDVLRAQTEITRLDEQLAALQARRSAATAEINAILQRPPLADFAPRFPRRVEMLATAAPTRAAFTSAALEGGLGDAFPSLSELQLRALENRPMLQAHEHRIEAARHAVRLAERERVPEIEVMVGYGIRWGRPDMLSAGVAAPLPIFAGRKQRQAVAEAGHELAAQELTHHQMVSEIQGEIAARYAALVRTREQILLMRDGVIPQARATIESSAAAYNTGRVEFMSLLDAQATLFRNEIELARQLSDFGRELAALERATGIELVDEEAP